MMTQSGLIAAYLFAAICAVALLTMPFYTNQGVIFLVGLMLIQALFALSWALLFARTGLLVFGHAGFFALGAYTVGYLLKADLGIPFLVLLLLGILVAAAVAILLGILVVERASGVAFAILTLALSEILRTLISYSDALGRDDGMAGIPRPFQNTALFGTNGYFWFMCLACGAGALFLYWFSRGRIGRILYCIRQDSARTAFMGYNVRFYRILSLAVSAGIAGGAGALYAPWAQIVTPEIGNLFQSTQPMLNTLLGGAGFFAGPVVGAVIFTVIGYVTRTMLGLSELITGGILLLIILLAPSGVLGLVGSICRRLRELGGSHRDKIRQGFGEA